MPSPQHMEPVEIEIYETVPGQPGLVRRVHNRTVGEVWQDLKDRLEKEGLLPDEYMGVAASANGAREFPRYRFLACYPVTGGNEGHYIHVDVLKDGKNIPIFLGKTFQGMDFAAVVAAACARHLGA